MNVYILRLITGTYSTPMMVCNLGVISKRLFIEFNGPFNGLNCGGEVCIKTPCYTRSAYYYNITKYVPIHYCILCAFRYSDRRKICFRQSYYFHM